ncbi:hypothetical protein CesoFtcFv8_025011 [Champsocephalus esox]|uniref:Uncharacterized protein n=1 Tax=Champsocephalus esox TaxID=159716 RepID=A0AAN8B2Y3_9TELE|nr:hypothetical protein CesoFtcFv8_025011 [Champsocephalus esox]
MSSFVNRAICLHTSFGTWENPDPVPAILLVSSQPTEDPGLHGTEKRWWESSVHTDGVYMLVWDGIDSKTCVRAGG